MRTESLITWLRGMTAKDALLSSWRDATDRPTMVYEADALTIAALGSKTGTPVTIAMPGGHTRLPLLAAVHAAALRLPGFPSPFSGTFHGPAALVTRQIVRRQELVQLDAAGVPVSPALHPVRLRADGLVVPLSAGKPRPQDTSQLLVVGPSASWTVPVLPPSTVIVDAANEPDEFVRDAVAWATACGATPVVFVNVVRRLEPPQNTVVHACGWSAILAASPSVRDPLATLATVRGHAAVLDAGTRPGLAATAALLADARRHGPFPSSLLEAAVLWRRLSELVVPVTGFDAACPRWFTPTLSERLNDLAAVRASDFPRGWRTWAETCWAAVKEGLASARDGLDADNTKARLLVEAIDADLRAGLSVDVALPSRVARDALIQNLAEAGVLTAIDGRLSVRSLADPESWAPRRATLLVAPPTVAQRHRLVAGDIGPLNVLCYAHEVRPLRRMLVDVLDEPLAPQGPVRHLLPSALDVSVDLPGRRPAVVIAIAAADTGHDEKRTTLLAHLADAVDIAGLDALRDASDDTGLDELPEAEDGTATVSGTTTLLFGQARSIAAVPLTVVVTGGTEPLIVHVPAQGTILRLLMGSPRRMAVLDVAPGMLITALDGVSPFERLRPLLVETRGPVTRMLLTAWDQAVDEALQRVGGPAALARALARDGGDVTASAVAKWVDENRIGPRDAKNVARVGKLAHHPVVADNATAIAEVMRRLRALHHVVGRVVADPNDLEGDAANELERLLGPDAVSIAAQTVIYQVRAVDAATTVDQCELYQVRPVVDTGDYRREEKGDRRS